MSRRPEPVDAQVARLVQAGRSELVDDLVSLVERAESLPAAVEAVRAFQSDRRTHVERHGSGVLEAVWMVAHLEATNRAPDGVELWAPRPFFAALWKAWPADPGFQPARRTCGPVTVLPAYVDRPYLVHPDRKELREAPCTHGCTKCLHWWGVDETPLVVECPYCTSTCLAWDTESSWRAQALRVQLRDLLDDAEARERATRREP